VVVEGVVRVIARVVTNDGRARWRRHLRSRHCAIDRTCTDRTAAGRRPANRAAWSRALIVVARNGCGGGRGRRGDGRLGHTNGPLNSTFCAFWCAIDWRWVFV